MIVLRDYPDELSNTIETHLKTDFTLTGYYGDSGLEWVLEYRGARSTVLLELAVSEYIIDAASVNSVYNVESQSRLHSILEREQKNEKSI